MSQPQQVTEEQVAAAQLRMVLDEKLGRQTPELVREIAEMAPADLSTPSSDQPSSDQPHRKVGIKALISELLPSHESGSLRVVTPTPWTPTDVDVVVMLDPYEESTAALSLANILVARGDPDEAISAYEMAAREGSTRAMTALGELFAARGDLAGAEEWYRRALEALEHRRGADRPSSDAP